MSETNFIPDEVATILHSMIDDLTFVKLQDGSDINTSNVWHDGNI